MNTNLQSIYFLKRESAMAIEALHTYKFVLDMTMRLKGSQYFHNYRQTDHGLLSGRENFAFKT